MPRRVLPDVKNEYEDNSAMVVFVRISGHVALALGTRTGPLRQGLISPTRPARFQDLSHFDPWQCQSQ
jgi:hypothetical protein